MHDIHWAKRCVGTGNLGYALLRTPARAIVVNGDGR